MWQTKPEPEQKEETKQSRWGFRGKTVWDFLQLLIVPLMLVAIGLVFSLQQDARQQRIEDQRAAAERELAEQRAQDEALQAYLDKMSTLTLEKDLRHADAGDEVLTVARARTLAALAMLDPSRKAAVMQFITEAGLVQGSLDEKALMSGSTVRKEAFEGVPVISLGGADLSGADLSAIGGGLSSHIEGSSRGVYYFGGGGSTDLSGADLSYADLSGTNLRNAHLEEANLQEVNLSGTDLSQESYRRMSEEGVKRLTRQAASLKGATMPNGQKYEEWLKDKKAQGKDEKNE